MATFKSSETDVLAPADKVYRKLSNLEALGETLKDVPPEKIEAQQLEQLKEVRVTPDTISFPGGPVGEVVLRKTDCEEPTLIRLEGVGTPVPLSLSLHITPVSEFTCVCQVEASLQIPAMLKPMVQGPLQKMVDQFAQMLRQIPFDKE